MKTNADPAQTIKKIKTVQALLITLFAGIIPFGWIIAKTGWPIAVSFGLYGGLLLAVDIYAMSLKCPRCNNLFFSSVDEISIGPRNLMTDRCMNCDFELKSTAPKKVKSSLSKPIS